MTDSFYFLLHDLEVISSFIPVVFLLLTKSKTRRYLRRVLYLLSISWLFAEVLGWILARNGINTFLIFHVYGSISTVGYLLFFGIALPKVLTRSGVLVSSVSFLLMQWSIIISTNGFFEAVAVTNIMTSLIPFVLALLTFYYISIEAKIVNLLQEPIYWIISAILIHFGLGLVAIISLEYIAHDDDMILYVWPLVLIANIIHNIIFSIGVWRTNQV